MKILVKRESGRDEAAKSTHSLVDVLNDDDQLIGEFRGLEPDFDEVKEAGGSRIPEGTYRVGVRQEGAMTERYYERFDWFKGMLHVLDVPNYTNIYIHIGNFETDTAGCLLVGIGRSGDMITQSVDALEEFYADVILSAMSNNLTITYTDEETTS